MRHIKTFGNVQLKDFPTPENFPKIQKLALSYAYHCCLFLEKQSGKTTFSDVEETIVWLDKDDIDVNTWTQKGIPGRSNFSNKLDIWAQHLWSTDEHINLDNLSALADEYFEDYKSTSFVEEIETDFPIKCLPEPTPFMPCEDLFGWWTLRCGVWMVFLLALLGNGVVVVVLTFGRSKIDVPRFLVCNLAMADLFMGVYLGLLAVMDASTLGEFREYAVQWQTSWGCQLAGFLGVFSSELSVYTLAVITLERNYAITHAMHLNKRLSLKHASYIMSVGWSFAFVMALLPLFGISDYRKFAVCLPFEVGTQLSKTYVISLIVINGLAFVILMGCYLKMYCAIKGSQAWNSNDSRIAKRMALLVFTDFLCWAPIAFFSLTALSGWNLVSLEEAKIFTIFILPLNSCCNPFLYAIFTKQFKKDCAMLCKRIEESRVTRGIGRGRNSSNFSNRQTPLNTNSAADKKSCASDPIPPTVCICGLPLHASPPPLLPGETQDININILSQAEKTARRDKSRGKKSATRWFWGHRKDSAQSSSLKSSNLTSGSSLPQRSSLSSDNMPSSPTGSWKHNTHIPMRVIESAISRPATGKAPWEDKRRDSTQTQTSSTFKTTSSSATTRSSFSSNISGSKATDITTLRSVGGGGTGGHFPLTGSLSLNSNSMDEREFPERVTEITSIKEGVVEGRTRKGEQEPCGGTSGSNDSWSHSRSNNQAAATMMMMRTSVKPEPYSLFPSTSGSGNPTSFLCHDCVARAKISAVRGDSLSQINRNKILEEKLTLYFSKLAEADADASSSQAEDHSNDFTPSAGDMSTCHDVSDISASSAFQESYSSSVSTSKTPLHPVIEIQQTSCVHDDNVSLSRDRSELRDDVFLFPEREDSSRSPSTLSIRTQIPASRSPDSHEQKSLLGKKHKNKQEHKSSAQSLLNLQSDDGDHLPRKVSSETSLRKSLTNLPSTVFHSISSHFLGMSRSRTTTSLTGTGGSGEKASTDKTIPLLSQSTMSEQKD